MSELTARFDLPLGFTSPGAARRAVHALLTAWGLHRQEWLDPVMLVVSELVTNAVEHGGGCVGVDLRSADGAVVVGISDGSAVVPRRHEDDTRGHGIGIIDALTSGWGVEDRDGGKRVWARLRPYPSA